MVSAEANRFYLSGFTGEDNGFDESAGTLFITRTKLILATDSRFEQQAALEAPQFERYCYKKGLPREIHHILKTLDTKRLGIEERRVSFYQYSQIKETLTDAVDYYRLLEDELFVIDAEAEEVLQWESSPVCPSGRARSLSLCFLLFFASNGESIYFSNS